MSKLRDVVLIAAGLAIVSYVGWYFYQQRESGTAATVQKAEKIINDTLCQSAFSDIYRWNAELSACCPYGSAGFACQTK